MTRAGNRAPGRRTLSAMLARVAATTSYDSLPASVLDRGKDVIVDTIAVAAAGAVTARQEGLLVSESRGRAEAGSSTVIQTGKSASPVDAALANGAAASMDMAFEGHRIAGGHPALHVVPAVLAVSEYLGVSGREALAATIVGYEVTSHISLGMRGIRAGVLSNAACNTIGAAAASAYLVASRDPDAIEAAMEIAAGVTTVGTQEFADQGAPALHFLAGLGSSQGVFAALQASQGWTGGFGILERHFAPRVGRSFRRTDCLAGIGEPADGWGTFFIELNYFKIHSACAYAASSLDAAASLRAKGVTPPEISSMEIGFARGDHAGLFRQEPRSLVDARLSIAALTAVLMAHGNSGLIYLDKELLGDSEVARLRSVINVCRDRGLQESFPDSWPARVRVTTRNGAVEESLIESPRGHPDNPLSREEFQEKHVSLIARRYPREHAPSLISALRQWLDDGATIRDVSMALSVPPRSDFSE